MKVAVINEISAKDKNKDILAALTKCGAEVMNIGMNAGGKESDLTYIHTGLMAAVILNLGAADMAVGGCGTGIGFALSAMQYPGVFCGLLIEPLDAWLFSQINGGNCVSLPLNKGYGWAGGINLTYLFEKLFKDPAGAGYPPERAESQAKSRGILKDISAKAHKPMSEILALMDKEILKTIFTHEAFAAAVKGEVKNKELQAFILKNFAEYL